VSGQQAAGTGTITRPAVASRRRRLRGLVPPQPPDDDEKYLYIQRNLPYLTTVILIGSICLIVSQLRLETEDLALSPLLLFTATYVVYQAISLPVNFAGAGFDLAAHQAHRHAVHLRILPRNGNRYRIDIRRDYFRPGGWHEFEAGIDANGRLTVFTDHFVTFGSGSRAVRAADMNVSMIPAGLVQHLRYGRSMMPTVVTTGPLRAPGSNALCFASQSFLDEVALAAGTDLPSLMLRLLQGERREIAPADGRGPPFDTGRARGVIEKVMQTSNWAQKPQQEGRAKGFGFYFCHQGYFAEVAEASVAQGQVTVHKVWVVGDIGSQIVNPMGAENQVRGAIIDGLAQALAGQEIELVDGAVQQSNLNNFPLARISTTPSIEIAWVKSDKPPTGLGEPALPPVIPALTNAIFAATGTRVRSLPVRLKTA